MEKVCVPKPILTYLGLTVSFLEQGLVSGWEDLNIFPLAARQKGGLPDIWPLLVSIAKNWIPQSSNFPCLY